MLEICVRPWTIEQKMMGASIIRSSAMKASPSGFIATAMLGATMPSTTASRMPIRT